MAKSRELAEKAFTLLHDALRSSEERVAELDAELKRKKSPKNRTEERADVLAHRIESVEADCERWQREAGHLEELLDNERAKVAQLKKKLSVAESGPEKLTKKEVNFWRQRAEKYDSETREYKKRIAQLKQDLRERDDFREDFARSHDTGATSNMELEAALETARKDIDALREQLAKRDASLSEAKKVVDEASSTDDKLRETLQERDARIAELSAELEKTRSALGQHDHEESKLQVELDQARQELQQTAGDADRLRGQYEELGQQLADKDAAISQAQKSATAAQAERDELRVGLADRERQYQELKAEIDEIRSTGSEHENERTQLREQLTDREQELAQLRSVRQELEAKLGEFENRAQSNEGHQRELIDTLNNLVSQRDEKIAGLEARLKELDQEKEEVREQMAGLEEELKEEKECTSNVSELANERREELTKLEEQLEEAQERYEEAKWHLSKAAHFKRLAQKRRKLVGSVIAEYRAKVKANTALKAGIDGLRTFKATSEQSQQKLLAKSDELTKQLEEAQENLARYQSGTVSQEDLGAANDKVADLEERMRTQVELIESLEEQLNEAKAARSTREAQEASELANLSGELEGLKQELQSKNEAIVQLESDIDEQNKKLAKLRGSESETLRLKAAKEQDQTLIDTLQRENDKLKAQIAELEKSVQETLDSTAASANASLKDKDGTIANLKQTVAEQKKEIKKLSEEVAGWQKKYEFLSTEAPSAYQSSAAEK